MSITKKLDSVYGQRQPSLVESEDKLEDVVDKIPGINKVLRSRCISLFFRASAISLEKIRTICSRSSDPFFILS